MSDKKRWQIELEKYLKQKIQNLLGYDDDDEIEINVLKVEDLFDYDNIDDDTTIDDLATYYAFTMMTEEFEKTKLVKNELIKRECTTDLIVNDDKAVLNIYHKSDDKTPCANVKFNVVPEGLIIDFEKEEF